MTFEQGTSKLAEVGLDNQQLELLVGCLGKDRAVIAGTIDAMNLTYEQKLKLIEFVRQVKAEE